MMIKNKRTSKQARPVVEIFLGHPFYFCQVILPFFIFPYVAFYMYYRRSDFLFYFHYFLPGFRSLAVFFPSFCSFLHVLSINAFYSEIKKERPQPFPSFIPQCRFEAGTFCDTVRVSPAIPDGCRVRQFPRGAAPKSVPHPGSC